MDYEQSSPQDVKTYVTRELHRLGVPAHLKGFHYLRGAILMCIDDMILVTSVTKLVYPDVAKMFGTTGCKVERAIRNAIEVSWPAGDQKRSRELFGYASSDGYNRPTNSEYIAGIADAVNIWRGKDSDMNFRG